LSNELDGRIPKKVKTAYKDAAVQTETLREIPRHDEACISRVQEPSYDCYVTRLELRNRRRERYEEDNIDISHSQLPLGHSDDDRLWPDEKITVGECSNSSDTLFEKEMLVSYPALRQLHYLMIQQDELEDPDFCSKESQIEAAIRHGADASVRFSGRPPGMDRKVWAARKTAETK
jgi:hypothetical protein